MKAETVTWDTEHSILAEAMDYRVKRFDEIHSNSIRPTSNKLPSFMRGVVFYQYGYGFLFTFTHALINLKLKYIIGYLAGMFSHKKRIGNEKILKKIKLINDKRSFSGLESIFNIK